jgi:iron(III) transport system substrate-binding protein
MVARRRVRAALVAAAAGGLLLAACGGPARLSADQANATTGVTITLYNGQHEQTTQALVKQFEAQTGIRVRERDGDESALAEQIDQEGSASPADVFYSENSPALMALEGKHLLAPVAPTTLAQVPARYSSPQGGWVGVSARVSVLVYNTSRVQPSQVPTSVLDLADPKWKGKLALAPTETDFQPVVTSIAKTEGQKAALHWLKAVASNAADHIEPDNETLTADVNNGQAALGLLDHYYWYRLGKEIGSGAMHSQIAYFVPHDPGYVVNVSGAGVLKTSRHPAAAQMLLAFLVSATGQKVMVDSDSFEYPLRPGIAAPAGLRPFDELQPAPLTIAELGDGMEALDLIQQAQLV